MKCLGVIQENLAPEMSGGDSNLSPPVVTHRCDEGLSLPVVIPSHTAHKAVTNFAGISG